VNVKRLGLQQAPPRAPYADDPPREITDEDLSFLSDYTGERDLAVLRRHVLKVWAAVKAKVREHWVFLLLISLIPHQRGAFLLKPELFLIPDVKVDCRQAPMQVINSIIFMKGGTDVFW